MDNFASVDTPGDPGAVKVVELSGMKPESADSVTVRNVNNTYADCANSKGLPLEMSTGVRQLFNNGQKFANIVTERPHKYKYLDIA